MNWNRISAVLDKERADLFCNKMVLYTLLIPALLFIIIPVVLLVAPLNATISTNNPGPIRPDLSALPTELALRIALLTQFVNYLLIIPAAVTSTIAAYSIIGEKEQRTLEPLLATPIKTSELLLAKAIAAALPGVLAAWFDYAVILIATAILGGPVVFGYLAHPALLGMILLVVPALTVLAVGISVIISSRVSDVRAAQQISSILVVPVILGAMGQLFGAIPVGIITTLIFFMVLVLVDIAIVLIGTRLFQRETILTRWK